MSPLTSLSYISCLIDSNNIEQADVICTTAKAKKLITMIILGEFISVWGEEKNDVDTLIRT